MKTVFRARFAPLLILCVALTPGACSKSAPAPEASTRVEQAPSAVPEVTKQVFGDVIPASAHGQELYLYTVVIPAGAEIAPHTHPGAQLGHIEEGTLTYTVLHGEVSVIRDAGTTHATVETVRAGNGDNTTELEAGDTVVESKGMIHMARNEGDTEVRVLLASLFPVGAELSSPVPQPPGLPIPSASPQI